MWPWSSLCITWKHSLQSHNNVFVAWSTNGIQNSSASAVIVAPLETFSISGMVSHDHSIGTMSRQYRLHRWLFGSCTIGNLQFCHLTTASNLQGCKRHYFLHKFAALALTRHLLLLLWHKEFLMSHCWKFPSCLCGNKPALIAWPKSKCAMTRYNL